MSNPWLKKNPFMSMWLSGANKIAGSARSQVAAEAKRQISHTLAQATQENVKRWVWRASRVTAYSQGESQNTQALSASTGL